VGHAQTLLYSTIVLYDKGITSPQVLGDIEIAQSMQKDQQEASQNEEV